MLRISDIRIGTKLGITAAAGVVLALGIIGNQIRGDGRESVLEQEEKLIYLKVLLSKILLLKEDILTV